MVEGKYKFALWLTPEAKELVEKFYRSDGCKSQSEFIEKAIRFYCGYLAAEDSCDFLPRVLSNVLEGRLNLFADRVGRLLFKLLVEQAVCNHLLSFDSDLDYETLDGLRKRSVQDVKRTNGQISFKDILTFQKDL